MKGNSYFKILFVHQELQSFVQKDLDILQSVHDVRSICIFDRKDLIQNLFSWLLFLWRGVLWSDITFCWFGKLHAFFSVLFAKIMGKKIVVVAGGDDVAKQTTIGRPYGLFAYPLKMWIGYFIFRFTDKVIAISKYNYTEVINNTPAGVNKTQLVYHGFDPDVFYRIDRVEKEKIISTVGNISYENCWRKGFELIKETANLMPDFNFYIIGPADDSSIDSLGRSAPANLYLTGGLYNDDLLKVLSKTSVYLQVSEWESFGCALAEAMLCECVPVVFNGTALPEVVGECGFYIDQLEPEAVAERIKEALEAPLEMGKRARQRIVEYFPLEKRRRELLKAVMELTGK